VAFSVGDAVAVGLPIIVGVALEVATGEGVVITLGVVMGRGVGAGLGARSKEYATKPITAIRAMTRKIMAPFIIPDPPFGPSTGGA